MKKYLTTILFGCLFSSTTYLQAAIKYINPFENDVLPVTKFQVNEKSDCKTSFFIGGDYNIEVNIASVKENLVYGPDNLGLCSLKQESNGKELHCNFYFKKLTMNQIAPHLLKDKSKKEYVTRLESCKKNILQNTKDPKKINELAKSCEPDGLLILSGKEMELANKCFSIKE